MKKNETFCGDMRGALKILKRLLKFGDLQKLFWKDEEIVHIQNSELIETGDVLIGNQKENI